jgi:chemotaxis protein CheX
MIKSARKMVSGEPMDKIRALIVDDSSVMQDRRAILPTSGHPPDVYSRSGERARLARAGKENMSVDSSVAPPMHEKDWLPVLELAVEEVFEIMLGCRVKPVAQSDCAPQREFTAMVGLAGSLCGIVTVCCGAQTAAQLAKSMLGDAAKSEAEVADALGEICNMIAGNFKNKLAGTDERCMLSVPTVVSGAGYTFHTMAGRNSMETILLFDNAPVAVGLQLQS